MTAAATVAVEILRAMGITDPAQIRIVLAVWCRPPWLSAADLPVILAVLGAAEDQNDSFREDIETGQPHDGVGWPAGRAARKESDR